MMSDGIFKYCINQNVVVSLYFVSGVSLRDQSVMFVKKSILSDTMAKRKTSTASPHPIGLPGSNLI